MKANVQEIFPTPIYFSSLERKLSKEEFNFINKHKKELHKNTGNLTSNNNYILEEKPFKKLKKEMFSCVEDYANNVLCYKNVTPYITQSWLNFTEENEYHHIHEHPNSLISGVFYINADENNDAIKLFNTKYLMIRPEVTTWNVWNSLSWRFPVKTGLIILFPSSLTHSVDFKKGNNTRVSLAFNVFVKGILGDNKSLTELKL
jgi:hypothetical protein